MFWNCQRIIIFCFILKKWISFPGWQSNFPWVVRLCVWTLINFRKFFSRYSHQPCYLRDNTGENRNFFQEFVHLCFYILEWELKCFTQWKEFCLFIYLQKTLLQESKILSHIHSVTFFTSVLISAQLLLLWLLVYHIVISVSLLFKLVLFIWMTNN